MRRATLLLAVVMIGVGVFVPNAVAYAPGAKRSPDACTKSVDALASYLAKINKNKPVIQRAKVYASFQQCKTADAWRVRGEHADIGPKLGVLLANPSLDTDRAFDVLCQHFDQYDTTSTCKGRNGADTDGSTTG
jgi:hypothetical protein